MQTSHQERQINNLGAQLVKLRAATAKAVAAAHEAVEIKEGYILEVANLEKEVTDKTEELNRVQDQLRASKTAHRLILSSTEALQKQSATEQDIATAELKKAVTKTEEKQNYISVLDNSVTKEQEKLNLVQKKLSEILLTKKNNIEALNKKIVAREQELKDLEEKAAEVLSDINDSYSIIEKEREQLDKDLADSQKEMQKIQEAAKKIESREKALSVREEDIAVIARRITKKYEEEFPGRKLTI